MLNTDEELKRKTPAQPLSEQAYIEIRTRILRGDFDLGESLPRRQLAQDLGIGVQPVTEALQRLESEGLVESEARVGTRVRIPSIDDIRGTVVLRAALESQAARLFVSVATRAEKEEIRALAKALDETWESTKSETANERKETVYKAHELHHKFHLRIAEYANCEALRKVTEVNLVSAWVHHVFLGDLLPPPGFHNQLAEVLSGSDPVRADEAVREHVYHNLDRTLERLTPFLQWDRTRLKQVYDATRE